jgi:AraC family transcriptional regulator, transcriptional activator of pobA
MQLTHTEKIECALRDRVFSLPGSRNKSWVGLYFASGSGVVRSSGEERSFNSTSLIWAPWAPEMSLSISAGGVGQYFTVSEESLANAIGHSTEASELRLVADRFIAVELGMNNPVHFDSERAFETIQRESQTSATGAASMIEAQLRVLLVLLLRNSPRLDAETSRIGRTSTVLQKFRQLVETHFRDRWTIRAYASEIGISSDRLHDLCTRNLDKTPSQLVHERMIYESRRMLETTTLSVDQLSGALGFRDTTYFSRFFKSKVGFPPATFRRNHLLQKSRQVSEPPTDFADWP